MTRTVPVVTHMTREQPVDQPALPIGGGCVLLVDDHEPNRIVGEALLRSIGFDVELATDAVEALRIVGNRHSEFVAVLMDIQMPQIDGYTATRVLRRAEAACGCARLPVIAATALAMDEDRDRCLQSGMDAHLRKPIERKELVQVLSQFAAPRSPGFIAQSADASRAMGLPAHWADLTKPVDYDSAIGQL
jgi:CheY-like chemotaxis protein